MAASPEVLGAADGISGATLVEGRGLAKRYGRLGVLEGAEFVIEPGVTGLLGANGSGKTTLLSLLLGIQRPTAGTVRVLGFDPTTHGPQVRARIGYAPEHHQLPADLAANAFVQHVAEIHGLPRREATSRASDALWWVGLGEERFRALGTLSVGQRQRVKLAMAIAHDPSLVLLDEPTDGLDPMQREAMLALIGRIGHEFGMSVVLSSHLLDEVERSCDRVLMLAGGRVAVAGSLDEIRGTSRGVRIDVVGDAGPLAQALADRGLRVRAEASRVSVEVRDGDPSTAELGRLVRDVVADTGVALRRLQAHVTDLEELFVAADDGGALVGESAEVES
jgi:ABC-2 type transport system ATP-binding protein